jgi:hypothetical protein
MKLKKESCADCESWKPPGNWLKPKNSALNWRANAPKCKPAPPGSYASGRCIWPWLWSVCWGIALAALYFGAQAWQSALNAQDQQRDAVSRQLASAALANLSVDPELSILLALRAVDETYALKGTVLREAEEALHQALLATRAQVTVTEGNGVAFSPDGRFLAAAYQDKVVRVYALSIDKLMQLARQRLTRGFTEQECVQYLHMDTCPAP